jgi:hypothetical protein
VDKLLEKAIYSACLKSAVAMGDKIYELSWFGKNHAKVLSVRIDDKIAA